MLGLRHREAGETNPASRCVRARSAAKPRRGLVPTAVQSAADCSQTNSAETHCSSGRHVSGSLCSYSTSGVLEKLWRWTSRQQITLFRN